MIWPLRGLASNPALPPHLLDRLVLVPELHRTLAHRDDLNPDHVSALVAGGFDRVIYTLLDKGLITTAPLDEPGVALMVAMFDRSVARSLATHPEAWVRAALADWVPQLPADLIHLLAHDRDPAVVAKVACTQPLPLALAEELSGHRDEEVREALARSSLTPVEFALRFAEHEDEWVRESVARRTDLPVKVYEKFARDRSNMVRWTVADRPELSQETVRALATDPSEQVRQSLLGNPALPLDLLVALAPEVRPHALPRIAAATLDELRGLLREGPEVRAFVAARVDLPGELVPVLVADPEPVVAQALVANPVLSAEQVGELAERHGSQLYPKIAQHPNASGATLVRCLENEKAREHAAKHPNLPVDRIVDLLHDEPFAAAANPSLPVSVMERLVEEHLP